MLYFTKRSNFIKYILSIICFITTNCKNNNNNNNNNKEYVNTTEAGIDSILENKFNDYYDFSKNDDSDFKSKPKEYNSKNIFNNVISKLIDKVETEDGTKEYYKLRGQSMLKIKNEFKSLKFPLLKTRLLDINFHYNNEELGRHDLIKRLENVIKKLKKSLIDIEEHPLRVLLLSKRALRIEALLINSIDSDLKPSEERARETLYKNFENHLKTHLDLLEKLNDLNLGRKFNIMPTIYIYAHLDSEKPLNNSKVYLENITTQNHELKEGFGNKIFEIIKYNINRSKADKISKITKDIDHNIKNINHQLKAFEKEIRNRAERLNRKSKMSNIKSNLNNFDDFSNFSTRSNKVNHNNFIRDIYLQVKDKIQKITLREHRQLYDLEASNLDYEQKNLLKKKRENFKEEFHDIVRKGRQKLISKLKNMNFGKGYAILSSFNDKIRSLRMNYLKPTIQKINSGLKEYYVDYRDLISNKRDKNLNFYYDASNSNHYKSLINNKFNNTKKSFEKVIENSKYKLNKFNSKNLEKEEIEVLKNMKESLMKDFFHTFSGLRKEVKKELSKESFPDGYQIIQLLNDNIKNFRKNHLRPLIQKINRILDKNNIISTNHDYKEIINQIIHKARNKVNELIHDSERFIISNKSKIIHYKNTLDIETEKENLRNSFKNIMNSIRKKIRRLIEKIPDNNQIMEHVNKRIKEIRTTLFKPHIIELNKLAENIENDTFYKDEDDSQIVNSYINKFKRDINNLIKYSKQNTKEIGFNNLSNYEKIKYKKEIKRIKEEFYSKSKNTKQKIRLTLKENNYDNRISLLNSIDSRIKTIKENILNPYIDKINELLSKETPQDAESFNYRDSISKNKYQRKINNLINDHKREIIELTENTDFEIKSMESRNIQYHEIEELEDEKNKLRSEFQNTMQDLRKRVRKDISNLPQNLKLELLDNMNEKIRGIRKKYLRPVIGNINNIIKNNRINSNNTIPSHNKNYENYINNALKKTRNRIRLLIDQNKSKLPFQKRLDKTEHIRLENLKESLKDEFHNEMKILRQKARIELQNMHYNDIDKYIDELNTKIRKIRKTIFRPFIIEINNILDKNNDFYKRNRIKNKKFINENDMNRIKNRGKHIIHKINNEYLNGKIDNLKNRIKHYKDRFRNIEKDKIDRYAHHHNDLENDIRERIQKIKHEISNRLKNEHDFVKDDVFDHLDSRLNKFKKDHFLPLKHEIKNNIKAYQKRRNPSYRFKDSHEDIQNLYYKYKRENLPHLEQQIEKICRNIRSKLYDTNDEFDLQKLSKELLKKSRLEFRNAKQRIKNSLPYNDNNLQEEIINLVRKDIRELRKKYIRPLNEAIRKKIQILLENMEQNEQKRRQFLMQKEESRYDKKYDYLNSKIHPKYRDEFEQYKQKLNRQKNLEKKELQEKLQHANSIISKEAKLLSKYKKAKNIEKKLLREINKLKEELKSKRNNKQIMSSIKYKNKQICECRKTCNNILNTKKLSMRSNSRYKPSKFYPEEDLSYENNYDPINYEENYSDDEFDFNDIYSSE